MWSTEADVIEIYFIHNAKLLATKTVLIYTLTVGSEQAFDAGEEVLREESTEMGEF